MNVSVILIFYHYFQLKSIEETLPHSPMHQNEPPDNLEIIDVTPADANFGGGRGQPKQRSPHKNDLPMADQAELVSIAKDRSVSLEIDGKASEIRYYGFTATITKEDNRLLIWFTIFLHIYLVMLTPASAINLT